MDRQRHETSGTATRESRPPKEGESRALLQPAMRHDCTATVSTVGPLAIFYTHHTLPVLDCSGCGMHYFSRRAFSLHSTAEHKQNYALLPASTQKQTQTRAPRIEEPRAVLLNPPVAPIGHPASPAITSADPPKRQGAAGAPHAGSTLRCGTTSWARQSFARRRRDSRHPRQNTQDTSSPLFSSSLSFSSSFSSSLLGRFASTPPYLISPQDCTRDR